MGIGQTKGNLKHQIRKRERKQQEVWLVHFSLSIHSHRACVCCLFSGEERSKHLNELHAELTKKAKEVRHMMWSKLDFWYLREYKKTKPQLKLLVLEQNRYKTRSIDVWWCLSRQRSDFHRSSANGRRWWRLASEIFVGAWPIYFNFERCSAHQSGWSTQVLLQYSHPRAFSFSSRHHCWAA